MCGNRPGGTMTNMFKYMSSGEPIAEVCTIVLNVQVLRADLKTYLVLSPKNCILRCVAQ
jgi:hypothetical protein